MPSDPRFRAYNDAQLTHTYAVNAHMHRFPVWPPVDPQVWRYAVLPAMPQLADAMLAEMRAIAGSGLDE